MSKRRRREWQREEIRELTNIALFLAIMLIIFVAMDIAFGML